MNYYMEVTEFTKKYIECNIENDITPDDAAKTANYSLKQLNRIFSMTTGLTLGEYIRMFKLTQALFDLKYSEIPIIDIAFKYGYESQEAFTRAFKEVFSLNPGKFRKIKYEVVPKNRYISKLIHDEEHKYYYKKGIFSQLHIESWIIAKPNRFWASACRNSNCLSIDEFYKNCERKGIVQKVLSIPDTIFEGGAYLPTEIYNKEKWQKYLQAKIDNNKSNGYRWFKKWELSFGIEVEENYPLELLNDFEIIKIPESRYVVFNCKINIGDNHDDVIKSAWNAQKDYDLDSNGLKWAYDKIPYFETLDKEMGYTLWFPVSEV
ncbi:MAG: helix-turn-helix transcriptional regulator [Treponema sp.]|nr:helix-turn-helix transcriptional regulator [Treponema sp.]